MSNKLKTGVTGLAALLGILGIIFTLMAVRDHGVAVEQFGKDVKDYDSWSTNFALTISYILMGLCALMAIGAGVYSTATNFGNNKKVLYALVGVAVIFIIGYVLASGTIDPKWAGMEINENISKLSGMGVIASYVFAGLAVFSIAFFEIKNAFK